MLLAYGTEKGCLVEHGDFSLSHAVPEGSVWLDLVEPTLEEEKSVEALFGIDIPTRGELAEIEASSRLYQEDGASFMTANLIRRGDDERPESSPVTFIVKDNKLITIRYHHPQAFPVYIRQAMKPQPDATAVSVSGWGILISLVEAVVDRAADHLERVGAIVDESRCSTHPLCRNVWVNHAAANGPRIWKCFWARLGKKATSIPKCAKVWSPWDAWLPL
jgi:magnesium transporter